MSKYTLFNPTMPSTHLTSMVTWNGGGGAAPAAPVDPQAATEAAAAAKAKAKAAAKAKAEAAAKAKADKAARVAAEAAAAEEARVVAAKKQSMAITGAAANMQQASVEDPSSLVTTANVAQIDPNAAGTNIDTGTGSIDTPAPQITDPTAFNAGAVDATTAANQVAGVTNSLTAAQGAVSAESLATAATADPTQMSGVGTDNMQQIAEATRVAPVAPRVIQQGELISGSAVDMAAVNAAIDVQAAQATPSEQATVQGQLAGLMQDFEGTEPPAWASGALRNATAQMAARGLGASSMAGQALVQAAMESALPIAMQDASTFAKFEGQNLSNRQQTAMFGAQQRAQFLGMQFTQDFQARVANASRIGDVANMNFTAEQQVALENARMAQTVDITNLNAINAKVMADAAAMSQMDMANLNNRQQASVQNAQAFLAMDMKNLDIEQQTNMFKAQSNIQAIFSDQSAINAAKQFNASSENQTNQFFANMATQVQQFNAGMDVQRDQFNAQNALVVAQANAQWRQNTSTINTGAQNEANRAAALEANGITQSMVDVVWQRERDIMDYAFRQSESATDRALSVFLADKQVTLAEWESGQADSRSKKEGIGFVLGKLIDI
jgi:hypothetical protein